MASVRRFLTDRMKLQVNEAKSAVDRPWKRKFLGFSFLPGKRIRIRLAPESIKRFKEKVRELTRAESKSGAEGTHRADQQLCWGLDGVLCAGGDTERDESTGPMAEETASSVCVETVETSENSVPQTARARVARARGRLYGEHAQRAMAHRGEPTATTGAETRPTGERRG